MSAPPFWQLGYLCDSELVSKLATFAGSERHALARVLAHLAEVQERRLDLTAGCSSLFDYCVRRLGFSEGEAFRRVTAARLARRFPRIFEAIESGSVHLTAICLVRHHLTPTNHEHLLKEISNKTTKQVEALLACWFPQPDVAATIRKLPARRGLRLEVESAGTKPSHPPGPDVQLPALRGPDVPAPDVPAPDAQLCDVQLPPLPASDDPKQGRARGLRPRDLQQPPIARAPESPSRAGGIEPLSPARYRLQLTASEELKGKLERARDLMSHKNPSGDLALVLEQALDLLIAKLEKARFGSTERAQKRVARVAQRAEPRVDCRSERGSALPQAAVRGCAEADVEHEAVGDSKLPARERAGSRGQRSRHVPNSTRREVLARDGARCTYVDAAGRRCESTAFLQLHHETPWAAGGDARPDNIRVLCRAHNRLRAELDFGREHIDRHVAQAKAAFGANRECAWRRSFTRKTPPHA
ncbi:MAG TPA: HNH endonuclease signature motif containing protein [Polyangiaceae bacterium]|nr:HNH endonuclease signature motif containing protein [Polyangiaceae bacterium]